MPKSMLDPIIRALVGLDVRHHGLVLDVVNKLNGPKSDQIRAAILRVQRARSFKFYRSKKGAERGQVTIFFCYYF